MNTGRSTIIVHPPFSYENLFQFDFHLKFRHGHFRSRVTFPSRFESGVESHPARPVTTRRGSKTKPITKRYRATRNINIYACITVITPTPLLLHLLLCTRFFPISIFRLISRSGPRFSVKRRWWCTRAAQIRDEKQGREHIWRGTRRQTERKGWRKS